jgi:hypothetical protein
MKDLQIGLLTVTVIMGIAAYFFAFSASFALPEAPRAAQQASMFTADSTYVKERRQE